MNIDKILTIFFAVLLIGLGLIMLILEKNWAGILWIVIGGYLIKVMITKKISLKAKEYLGIYGFSGGLLFCISLIFLFINFSYGIGSKISYLALILALILLILGIRWIFLFIRNFGGLNMFFITVITAEKNAIKKKPSFIFSYLVMLIILIIVYIGASYDPPSQITIDSKLFGIGATVIFALFFILIDISYTLIKYSKKTKEKITER